jgi:hypothetical protein
MPDDSMPTLNTCPGVPYPALLCVPQHACSNMCARSRPGVQQAGSRGHAQCWTMLPNACRQTVTECAQGYANYQPAERLAGTARVRSTAEAAQDTLTAALSCARRCSPNILYCHYAYVTSLFALCVPIPFISTVY